MGINWSGGGGLKFCPAGILRPGIIRRGFISSSLCGKLGRLVSGINQKIRRFVFGKEIIWNGALGKIDSVDLSLFACLPVYSV